MTSGRHRSPVELTDKGSGRSSADRAAENAEGAGRSSREMAGKGSGRLSADTAGEGAEGAGRLGSRTGSGSEVLGNEESLRRREPWLARLLARFPLRMAK